MDLQETQRILSVYLHELADLFHRVPGSAIFLRYVKSSYQDDPIRSAVELFLFLFAVRSVSYTHLTLPTICSV